MRPSHNAPERLAAAAASTDPSPEAEHPDPSTRYAADHAALAFGIPRIAPVPMAAADAEPAAGFSLEVEDLTESLTADEREAAEAAAFAALDPADPSAAGRPGEAAVSEPVSSEPVTAALRMPPSGDRQPGPRPAWGVTLRQPLTERLTVHTGHTATRARTPHRSLLGAGPGEAATTTVTLPAGPAPLESRGGRGVGRPSLWALGKMALLGAGAALALGLAVLLGRAWPLLDAGSRAVPPTPQLVRPADGIGRERLIEQAVTALREGRREHALALLGRYQATQPAGEPDQAVEIMIRVLHKDRLVAPGAAGFGH